MTIDMKCIRCSKDFNTDIQVENVTRYNSAVRVACPHCGKLYRFRPIMHINIEEMEDYEIPDYLDSDDWSVPVVKDSEYKK